MTARPRRARSTLVGGPAAGRVAGELRTAFVLAGGAALGAMQAGMVRALYERGIATDLLIGTSAGVLNAAFLASRPATVATAEELAAVWRGLRRSDIFPLRPGTLIVPIIGLTRLRAREPWARPSCRIVRPRGAGRRWAGSRWCR